MPSFAKRFLVLSLYLMPLLVGSGLIAAVVFVSVAPNVCMRFAEWCANPLLCLEKKSVSWVVNNGVTGATRTHSIPIESPIFGGMDIFPHLSRHPFRISVLPRG